jgi:serine/threonine protein kinase
MGKESPDGTDPGARLPVSTFVPSAEKLVRQSLNPPPRPGLLGNLDRYEVLRLIGAGGMGLVLLARDTEARLPGNNQPATSSVEPRHGTTGGALVAIKMIKPELALEPRAVHRFLKEARHMQRLSHPKILTVLDIADGPQCPYFVMPYIERGSLANLIQNGQIMDRERTLAIARQISSAVAHAHSRGIIHRDLKPSNVLVDQETRAYLTDFGLARTMFNDSVVDVRLDHCEGTAPYLSPALAAGEAEDTRCDIYAFGAMLYEMLTGRPPYEGQTTQEILKLIRAGPPRSILDLNPDAPRELAAIANAAMARELRDRYARMSDVALDLDCIANQEPPSIARGLSNGSVKRKKSAPPPKALLTAAAAVVLLAGLMGWNRVFTHRSPDDPRLRVVRSIELPGVWRWSEARVGRWQLDHEEAIFLPHDDKLLIVSRDGQVLHEWRSPDAATTAFTLDMLSDLDGDGLDDPVVSWRVGKRLHTAVLNYNLFPLKRFTAEGALRTGAVETGTSGMRARKVVDLNRDGKRELLASVGTGYELKPRGLYCFDYETGGLLWRHDTGPYLTEVETIDLDRDGMLEVVAGSHAVNNGNRADDGTDDGHCYVYAWSSEGNVLWTKQLEGPFVLTHPLVADLGADAEPGLLAWVTGSHFYRQDQAKLEVGTILKLDSEGATVANYDAGARLISCVVADLDGDGASEIIATDRHGFVHVLNRDLTLRAKTSVTVSRYDVADLRIAAVTDLDRDGHPEMILTSTQQQYVSGHNHGNLTGPPNVRVYHDGCIVVLSHELKQVARYVVAPTWKADPGFNARVADLGGTGTRRILSLSDKALLLEYVPAKEKIR